MKKMYALLLCLMISAISNNVFGQSVANTSFNTTSAGWFQVGKWTGSQRGSERVAISFYGGSYTPQELIIDVFKDWSSGLYLDVKGVRNSYIRNVRVTKDDTYYYLEVNIDRAITTSKGYLHLYNLGGKASGFTLNSGNLPLGTGTVMYETESIVNKTLFGNTLDARKDLLVNGRIGIGTTNLSGDKLTVAGNVNIGGEGYGSLKIRHINGKDAATSSLGNLYLNYGTEKDVWVGNSIKSSSLLVYGNIRSSGFLLSDTYRNLSSDAMLMYDNNKITLGSGNSAQYVAVKSGGQERVVVNKDGKVGIGTTTTGNHRLAVEGSIGAREIKVEASGWSDFVFEKDYYLPPLKEVENYIKLKGHLKDIPSAKEVERNGFYLGEMDAKLLQKIEELTLYAIAQEKKLQSQEKKIKTLQSQNARIEKLEEENKKLKTLLDKVNRLEKLLQR